MPATDTAVRPPAPAPPAARPPRRRHRRLRLVLRYTLLSIGAVVVLFPLYMAVVNSLLAPSQIAHQPPPFFPLHPQWGSYRKAWTEGDLAVYLRNSAIQTTIIVAGQLVTSVLAAYAFAFLEFPFKRTLFVVFLMTLMIPFEVTIATNLSTVSSLGWFNTFPGLTVPFLATGFGTFLLRQAFLQIPVTCARRPSWTATGTSGSSGRWPCPWPARHSPRSGCSASCPPGTSTCGPCW